MIYFLVIVALVPLRCTGDVLLIAPSSPASENCRAEDNLEHRASSVG